ncbi:MAG: Kelch repeat-containing protein [Halioglobus sp.]
MISKRLAFIAVTFWLAFASSNLLADSKELNSQWSQLADMVYKRSEISAAVLNGKVYVAGGIGFFRTLAVCETYTIESNAWSACADLPYPLHHVAMASDGVAVYAAGGYTSLGFKHDPAPLLWRLDEHAEQWTEVAALPEPVGEHAMLFRNGHLYIVGGRTPEGDSAALWSYNLTTKQWQRLADMPTPRHSFSIVLEQNRLWVMGGRSAALGSAITKTEIYDFGTNTWAQGPTLPSGGGGHVAVLNGQRIHIVGGEVFEPSSVLNRHDVYDLVTKRWLKEPPPPFPRHGMSGVVVDDGILIFGGGSRPGLSTVFSVTSTVQRFAVK